MKCHVISCHVLWRELCYYASHSPHVFTFEFLPQGLHNTPEILRSDLQGAIDRVPAECDAVLIGYGLCSNGLVGITARSSRLVVMRAHDCITFLLGSRQRYREYFDSHPGTYWYSPGWIDATPMPGEERHNLVRQQYVEQYGEENADYLMEMEQGWLQAYNNCAYVDLGFGDSTTFKDYTQKCADWLGWKSDFLEGDPQLVKDFVDGRWERDDFLVVQPGERIAASHDERILVAEKAEEPADS